MLVRREMRHDPFQFHVPLQSLVKRPQVDQSPGGVRLPPAKNLLPPPFKVVANSADLFACFDLPRGVAHPLFAV